MQSLTCSRLVYQLLISIDRGFTIIVATQKIRTGVNKNPLSFRDRKLEVVVETEGTSTEFTRRTVCTVKIPSKLHAKLFKGLRSNKCGNIPTVRIVPGQGVVHTMVIDMEAIHRQRFIMGRLVDIMGFLFRQLTFI